MGAGVDADGLCTFIVTGGAGAMGLTVAGSVLESGGDVVLVDLGEGLRSVDRGMYI